MPNLPSEIANKANGATTDFKNKILNSEHQLEKLAHSAGEKAGAMVSSFSKSTSESIQSGREYVKENPAKSIAIAAAAGLVTGSLLTLLMRSGRKD